MNHDLSIVVPARNEEFLKNTVDSILRTKRGKTEVIVGLDGQWPLVGLEVHKDVKVIYYPESIGQRAIANKCVALSNARYIMKVDAHCDFDKGFDVKMMELMEDDITMVPVMKNLHAFDWVCRVCNERWYQGPTPTKCKKEDCSSTEFKKDIIWKAKKSPNSIAYCFDPEPHFQYFNSMKKRINEDDKLTETMSLQGSCFMVTRERYLDLNLCDEAYGIWGSQGIEVACKTWLSGGRVLCNHTTWYAHMFRTQGGDFGFPYKLPNSQVEFAKKYAREQFFEQKWPLQQRPLSWLVEKFWPVDHWKQGDLDRLKESEKGRETVKSKPKKIVEEVKSTFSVSDMFPASVPPSKGVVYYTNNNLDSEIFRKVITNLDSFLDSFMNPHNFIKVSLNEKVEGSIVLPLKSGYLTMFRQILVGLTNSTADVIFFCEHDVLYHPSHFDFTPTKKDTIYYNTNVWKVRYNDGFAIRTDDTRQTSGMCAHRDTLIEHYKKRVGIVERKFNELGNNREYRNYIRKMGFEPGTHNRDERVDDLKSDRWESTYPNLDIRHDKNLTPNRWRKDQFRDQRYTKGWQEKHVSEIEGWEQYKD